MFQRQKQFQNKLRNYYLKKAFFLKIRFSYIGGCRPLKYILNSILEIL